MADYGSLFSVMARGTGFNPLGQFAEGFDRSKKRLLAQQVADESERNNRAMEDLKRQQLMQPEQPSADMQLLDAYRKDPETVGAYLGLRTRAASNKIMKGPNNEILSVPSDGSAPEVIMPAPPKEQSPMEMLNEQKTMEKIGVANSTLSALKRAKELVEKAYTGEETYGFSGEAATMGTNFPNVYRTLGGDPARAEATKELDDIRRSEAVAQMAVVLPGPASDRDVKEWKEIMADPNASRQRKNNLIDRMSSRLEQHIKDQNMMLEKWRRGGRAQAPAEGAPPPADGGSTPNQWDMQALEDTAKKYGISVDEVLKRLNEKAGQ